MSFGEFLLYALLIVPFAFLVGAFLVYLTLLMTYGMRDFAEELGFTRRELVGAVVVTAFVLFFAWLVLDCPGCEGQDVPHAVEGREEWIDAREGTTYSQVERRTDE